MTNEATAVAAYTRYVVEDVGDASLAISFYKRKNVIANLVELCHNTFCLRDAGGGKLLAIPVCYRTIGNEIPSCNSQQDRI